MSQYARLSVDDTHQMMSERKVNVIDIRDADSFRMGHITDAVHIDNSGVQSFIENTDQEIPLVVCCYHGNSSQSAGAYLAAQGFAQVYSLDGGYAEWSSRFPNDCQPS